MNCILNSGNRFDIKRITNELIPHYYILIFPPSQGEPTSNEVAEMLMHGINQAKSLAKALTGDEEAYSILYSGYSARREKGWHVHIVLLGNRWRKAWLYLALAGKNLLQAIGFRKDDSPRTK